MKPEHVRKTFHGANRLANGKQLVTTAVHVMVVCG